MNNNTQIKLIVKIGLGFLSLMGTMTSTWAIKEYLVKENEKSTGT